MFLPLMPSRCWRDFIRSLRNRVVSDRISCPSQRAALARYLIDHGMSAMTETEGGSIVRKSPYREWRAELADRPFGPLETAIAGWNVLGTQVGNIARSRMSCEWFAVVVMIVESWFGMFQALFLGLFAVVRYKKTNPIPW